MSTKYQLKSGHEQQKPLIPNEHPENERLDLHRPVYSRL